MMTIDPVCGKQVADQEDSQTAEYAGQRYVFCSPECLQRFDAEQDLFTNGPGEGRFANDDRGVHPDGVSPAPPPPTHAVLEQPASDAGPG
jgi:YHS domain-containing protein